MLKQDAWGQGFAEEANDLLLRFLFHELGLRVVWLWTHSGNPRAIRLAEKVGFRVAARFRDAIFKDGHLLENVAMDQTRDEFYARHPDLIDRLPDPFT